MSDFEKDLALIREYFINPNDLDIPIINFINTALSIHQLTELFNNETEFEFHKNRLKEILIKKMMKEDICQETQNLILSFMDIDIINSLYEKYEIQPKKGN